MLNSIYNNFPRLPRHPRLDAILGVIAPMSGKTILEARDR